MKEIVKKQLLLSLLLLFFLDSCNGQSKKGENLETFNQVWNNINEHFYDQDFNNIDWEKKYIEYKSKIDNCNNSDTLFLILNEMLFELNSSHCGVGLLSELENVVSPYIFKNGDIGIDIRIIKNQIIITKVFKNSSASFANIKPGYIIERINGLTIADIEKLVKYKPPFNERNKKFHLTSEVLRHIYGESGTTVKIDFLDENNQPHSKRVTRIEKGNGILLGGGMPPAYLNSESYFISDNVAYLSFNAFNPTNMGHVLNNLEKIYKSKGLIIDLRGNDGGSIEGMKLLLGRFISERKKYGTYINRNERNEDFIEPTGTKYQGEVVILVDEMSISGAENMAGIVQLFKIGKIIGKQTPGQMLWGNGYLINDSIALAIPIYKLEYINGFNPENNGITPDIKSTLNRKDLLRGKDTQIEKAIEYLNNKIYTER